MTEENVVENKGVFKELLKPLLIVLGAFMILLVKGYVSSKLLITLVFLDYLTFNLISKLPVPVCFVIFMTLTTLAVI